MNLIIIFEERGISVTQRHYPHSPEEPEFLVTNGTDTFTTWEQPVLDYDTLRRELLVHREEKEREIASDVENDPILDKNDFPGYYGE